MPIKVQYFALFREQAKCESEELLFEGTHGELYSQLAQKYGFNLPARMIQVASNDEFTLLDKPVTPGSKIVFIPPVAGG